MHFMRSNFLAGPLVISLLVLLVIVGDVLCFTYARFLNRGVTLGLVNPRLVGYPWANLGVTFAVFETRVTRGFTNPGVTQQNL